MSPRRQRRHDRQLEPGCDAENGARSIASDLEKILANHGYQSETAGEDYISTGVNWGYTGAQLSDKLDPAVVVIIVGVLLLILLTGYLIIYNVFQISVAGDIRFYGLLKTIGTTPRQRSCGGSSAPRRCSSPLSASPWACYWAGCWGACSPRSLSHGWMG